MVQKKRKGRAWTKFALPVMVLAVGAATNEAAFAQESPSPAPKPAAAAGAPALPEGVVPPDGYVIGPEDVLSIVFWTEKDLSVEAAVRPDGMITVPLINDISAAGLTPDELRERIQTAASKFVEDATVTVVVTAINSRKVFITGMIASPGQYPLAAPTTVMQLIALAGGIQEWADEKKILIMRTENGRQVAKRFNYKDVSEGKNLAQNIDLLPGDTVVIP
jgi:polysaccharide export outer membrane protein